MPEFTHLHLHTDYSLLDGACDVDKLVKRVAELGQTSVAMTDHGNIFGAVAFHNAAKNDGGYRNLVKITSEASLHGMYYKPRVSKKFLAQHAKGLIVLSGCLAGELCENLM